MGAAPKVGGGVRREFAKSPSKRKEWGRRREGGSEVGGGEGGATSGRDALFQLHLLLRRGKRRLRSEGRRREMQFCAS